MSLDVGSQSGLDSKGTEALATLVRLFMGVDSYMPHLERIVYISIVHINLLYDILNM